MTDTALAIGLAGTSLAFCFGAGEVYDAWKYRHHSTEDPVRELRDWISVTLCWALITGAIWLFV